MNYMVPSAPPVKRRLSKPKTNDHTSHTISRPKRSQSSSSKSTRQPPDVSDEHWQSFDHLTSRPDAPKNLKQQFMQSFPEATRKLSLDSFRRTSTDSVGTTDAMGVKDRHSKTLSPATATASSPVTMNTASPLARQLSVVHEGPGMDIASAINLLQQLKKTASPEELVALHRALLPMQEENNIDERTPQQEQPQPPQHPTRRNSKLPPGLNTRGAPGDDLLRKLGDDVRRPRSTTQQTQPQRPTMVAQRSSSLGGSVTPIPEVESPAEEPERSGTPSDEQSYAQNGLYRAGTLRITNGAASPDPARMLRLQMPAEDAKRFDADPDSPGSPLYHPDRPVAAAVEPQHPGPHRVLHSQQRRPSRPLPPPPTESRRGSDASETQMPSFNQHTEEANPATRFAPETPDESPSTEPTPFILSQPPRPREHTIYGGAMNFGQSAPTREHASMPAEAKGTVAQFASRLSTVFGDDISDDESPGTPTHALAKLTGESRLLGPREPRSIKSLRSLPSPRPASMSQVDSGYGSSDASSQRHGPSPKPSAETPRAMGKTPRDSYTHVQRNLQAAPDGDTDSLYTFTEFLDSPKDASKDTASQPVSPSSPNSKKKKDLPSFLGLRDKVSVKRLSLPAAGLASSDSLASLNSSTGSERSGRTSKKLTKPIPERLKREKSLRVSPVSEIPMDEFPMVSQEMNRSLEQRYFQPSMSDLDVNRRASTQPVSPRVWDDGSRENDEEPKSADPAAQRKNPFHRKRSVSRGRKSNSRQRETNGEQTDSEKNGRIPFLRSFSRSRSRRRVSIDSADCTTPTRADFGSPAGDTTPRAPLERDAGIVKGAESWRTGPPRKSGIETAAAASPASDTVPKGPSERDAAVVKGGESWRTGLSMRKKTKSMGMTEEMASELARSKSRDVGGHERASMHDRPRMATPKKSHSRSHSRSGSTGPPKSGRSVEDFMNWQSKEPTQPSGPPKPDAMRRPYSMYADSIPPMPDIPIDVAAKTAKANKLMEKKKKDAFRKSLESGSENTSRQNSAASSPNIGKVKKAVLAREEQERRLEDRMAHDRPMDSLRPTARQTPSAEDVNIAVRELQGSSSEQSSLLETDSRPGTSDNSEVTTAASSVSTNEPSGFSGFEKQAALWRERRKSLGTHLPSSPNVQSDDESEPSLAGRVGSPEIVVSRYITPIGNQLAARALANQDPTSEATRHADLYRSLLDDEDTRPLGHDIPRTDSAYSSASSAPTVPKYQEFPDSLVSRPPMPQTRTVSGITTASSAYSSQYNALPRTRSPGGRVRTPSGNFYAYEPTHASQAERSRAASLGKLTPATSSSNAKSAANSTLSPASSTDGLSTIFSDTMTVSSCGGTVRAKPKNPHQRHRFPDPKSIKEEGDSSKPRRPRPVSSHSSNLADRYSGGLGWEWNRESGFGGSAGTRLNNETGTRRKGQRLAESFGVDLGDVPIFVNQSPDGLTPHGQQQKQAQHSQQRKGYFGAR